MNLTVKMKDGSIVSHKLRSLDGLDDDVIDSYRGNDGFWGTPSDLTRLKPNYPVRCTQMEYDPDFEFGSVDCDDNESDTDYV